jgi:hypothetical protein
VDVAVTQLTAVLAPASFEELSCIPAPPGPPEAALVPRAEHCLCSP